MTHLFDILGPTMVGPSSSHTAGACRLGYVTRALSGGTPERAHIGLHGSFAMTGEGHGTKRAIVGGLLGYRPDDPRLRDSLERARPEGLVFEFETVDLGEEEHPNSACLRVWREGEETFVQGASVGGGKIRVDKIDDFRVSVTGSLPTLVVYADDVPGTIAEIAGTFAQRQLNVATMRVDRISRGERALMTVEVDDQIPEDLLRHLRGQPWVHWIRAIRQLD